MAVLELLAELVEGRHVRLAHRGLVGDVEETPRELVVDARVDRDLFPELEGLDAVAEDRPALELTRAREPVDGVNELVRVEVVVAVRGREPRPAEQVAVRFPEHDRVVRHWVPLDRAARQHTREHEAEPHEGVEERVRPEGRLALDHPVVDDRVVDARGLTEVHKGLLLDPRLVAVRPHDLLGEGRALRDRPVDRRGDADVGLHHLLELALQARDAAPLGGDEREVGVRVWEAAAVVASSDQIGAFGHLGGRNHPALGV